MSATPLASERTHEAEPKSANPPETRRGFIHFRSRFFTNFISDLTTKISVKSTSCPGFLKSSHMADLRSSRRHQISL